ncbi:uncharacterized protein LOC114333990 isoform X2 [Diabrotica virgifera virgifera]|uniref:Uncharacterized protein LOC114333990 isoform X2 n=1 Tax=Diabrotica virgifera virgifera TaxID=50390 RepID=A0A6P7FU00_DIAVI|nr:uncharacterized protein LOC114333990 isoform X2 [Diabrotica virgifera virgifera]
MGQGLPFYLFLGLVHHFYLLDDLVHLNRPNCDIKRINEARTNVDICLRPEYNYTQIDFLIHGPKDDPYTFVQQRCSLKPVLDNCLHKTVDYLSVCFNDTMNQGLEVWKNIDDNMVEYLCKNNAEVALGIRCVGIKFSVSHNLAWIRGSTIAPVLADTNLLRYIRFHQEIVESLSTRFRAVKESLESINTA